jgi:hypothetical protein
MGDVPVRWIGRVAVAWLALATTDRLDAQAFGPVDALPDPARIGRPDPGGGASDPSGRADQGGDADERPGRLDPLFRAVDPSRLQRLFDRTFDLDPGDRSRRPRAPEIGEPVFFDVTRPLGDLKYSNELNYLYNSSTGNAPALQAIEYEYTFGDWRAAEIDFLYYNGNLEVLTPFYQRTLGVGRRRNWVHGYQISPDLYLRSGFIGGTAVYALGWKPEEESKFSSLVFLGANRALIGGFQFPRAGGPPVAPGDRVFGAWRPTVNVDVFYKLGEKLTLGFEADQFIQRGRAGEYLDFPFLTYEPGEHAFFQVGGGYYRFESRDQFTFFLHLNFVNPSRRKAREERAQDEPEPDGPREHGPIRRGLDRLFGGP